MHQYDKYLFIRYQYMQDTGIFELQERVSFYTFKYVYKFFKLHVNIDLCSNLVLKKIIFLLIFVNKMIAHFLQMFIAFFIFK